LNRQFIINKTAYKSARSELRNNLTSAENILWQEIRNKQLGLWFKRQVSISKFIVDFYCPQKKLIIELDGNIHKTKDHPTYDKQRDWYLKSMNFKILRFWNYDVINNLQHVLTQIKTVLE